MTSYRHPKATKYDSFSGKDGFTMTPWRHHKIRNLWKVCVFKKLSDHMLLDAYTEEERPTRGCKKHHEDTVAVIASEPYEAAQMGLATYLRNLPPPETKEEKADKKAQKKLKKELNEKVTKE